MTVLYAVGAFIVGTVVGFVLPGLKGSEQKAVVEDAIAVAEQAQQEMEKEKEE